MPTNSATTRRARSASRRPRRRSARRGRPAPRARAGSRPRRRACSRSSRPTSCSTLRWWLIVGWDRSKASLRSQTHASPPCVRGDQRHQPQPHRVGQRLEQRRDPLGLRRGRAARCVSGEQQATAWTRRAASAAQTSTRIYIDSYRCLVATLVRHRQSSNVSGGIHVPRPARPQRRRPRRRRSPSTAKLFGTEPAKVRARLRQLRRRRAAAQARPASRTPATAAPSTTSASRSPTPTRSTPSRPGWPTPGWPSVDERGTTCCYAKQDKFWVAGRAERRAWEVYTVLADASTMGCGPSEDGACAPTSADGVSCCVPA